MRAFTFLILCALVGLFTGCAILDSLLLDPSTGNYDSTGAAGTAGGLLGHWLPWATAATTTLGGLYANLRRGQYLKAGMSMARGYNKVREALKDGKINEEEATAIMEAVQNKEGTRQVARKIIKKAETT